MQPRHGSDWYGSRVESKLWVYTEGTAALYTITGDVIIRMIGIVKESLTTSDAITIEVGVAGKTAEIVAQVADATGLVQHEIYHDNAPDSAIEAEDVMRSFIISNGQDILLTKGGTLTAGEIQFHLFWRPLSPDGQVVSA